MTQRQHRQKTGRRPSTANQPSNPDARLDDQADSAYYDGIAAGYDELHAAEQQGKYSLIFSKLNLAKDDRILDVGCGTGLLFSFVQGTLGHIPSLCFGIDPSDGLLARVPQPFKGNVKRASAERIPFDDDAFDVVVCVTCLQNMRDPSKAVEEMRRVGTRTCRFAVSFLKKSPKRALLEGILLQAFPKAEVIEEEKDIIFINS